MWGALMSFTTTKISYSLLDFVYLATQTATVPMYNLFMCICFCTFKHNVSSYAGTSDVKGTLA
jgi:hypothetical protein